ncbi:protein FAM83A [Cyprinodon tularosa]|uniref:protein FAM83A n=1 Tax=Cyprinodon tularosa TaxID=77115 RepID=UPI0018E20739|nr:protein FAM83A [Cyprinodon tularosa]
MVLIQTFFIQKKQALCSSPMDAYHRLSVLSHRGSKPLGKVKQRVQDLRIPSSSNWDYEASGPRLDLSHNESARFAADSLLSQGLEGYLQALKAEGEVDFLSELEKDYILQNGSYSITDNSGSESLFADCQSCSCCPAVSTHIDSTVECSEHKTSEDVKSAPLLHDLSTEVFFQTDSSAAGMKDLVRQFLRKAKLALVVVMDKFSDPELLCDLLEASRKRKVSVHLLLDDLNLKLFVDMWQDLKLIGKNFPKVSVGSIPGQTYCAKTGKKLTGQIAESFIIADRQEVLTGTYSFTWLSGQVDRSMLVLIKGSSVSHFHQEFLRLKSSSKPVPGFNTFIPLQSLFLFTQSHINFKQCIHGHMGRLICGILRGIRN